MDFKNYLIIFSAFILSCTPTLAQERSTGDTTVVRPKVTDEVFNNPGKGLMTFQRFNGDTANVLNGCCGDFRDDFPFPVLTDSEGNLINEDYPNTSIAYFRFYWRFIEPEKGEYRWDIIDRALKTAAERGQTLMLAVMSHGSPYDDETDVPGWYRKIVGERREWKHDSPVNAWMVDAEDPRYAEHFGGLIRKLGERYDGHPDLEAVDVRIVGSWGEGAGSDLLTQSARESLVNAYADVFKKTPLIMLLTDERTNKYGLSQADMGFRVDCMGDLGFWADEQDGWTHMYDSYPQGIIEKGMRDAWEKAPVSFEICGTFPSWKNSHGYGIDEVEYTFQQALKWRMSSFNAKSAPIPDEWQPMVDEWIKKMGYRFVLRRFSYPKTVAPGGKLSFTSWWENKGVAPIYREYPLALRLRNNSGSEILLTEVDIREWMPGDNLYNDAVMVSRDLSAGEYQLELALIEPVEELPIIPKPAVKLAIDEITDDGWYRIGKIRVKE